MKLHSEKQLESLEKKMFCYEIHSHKLPTNDSNQNKTILKVSEGITVMNDLKLGYTLMLGIKSTKRNNNGFFEKISVDMLKPPTMTFYKEKTNRTFYKIKVAAIKEITLSSGTKKYCFTEAPIEFDENCVLVRINTHSKELDENNLTKPGKISLLTGNAITIIARGTFDFGIHPAHDYLITMEKDARVLIQSNSCNVDNRVLTYDGNRLLLLPT